MVCWVHSSRNARSTQQPTALYVRLVECGCQAIDMHTRCEATYSKCQTEGCDTIGKYQWHLIDQLSQVLCIAINATKAKRTSTIDPSTCRTFTIPMGRPETQWVDNRKLVNTPHAIASQLMHRTVLSSNVFLACNQTNNSNAPTHT